MKIIGVFLHKIYFAGSISGGRDYQDIYADMIIHLKKYGDVLTEHIGSKNLSSNGEDDSDYAIHGRDMEWLNSSDVVVADVTKPSLGVGYEIGRVTEMNARATEKEFKHLLCLYKRNDSIRISAMIKGNPEIKIEEYNDIEEAKTAIDRFFMDLKIKSWEKKPF